VQLLHALLDAALVGNVWREPLANGLALLAVGVPIWTIFWRRVQRSAERDDAEGESERDSWPRKLYLYGVALVGALVLLISLAQVLYRVLLTFLGEPGLALTSNELAHQLADSAVAGALWAVHLLAIRADGRFEKTPEIAAAPVDPVSRQVELAAQIAQLEAALAAARTELAALEKVESV
jgi:hypothetical protein